MISFIQLTLYFLLWTADVSAAYNATGDFPLEIWISNSTTDGPDEIHRQEFRLNTGVEYLSNETTIEVNQKVWFTTENGDPLCNTRYAMCAVVFEGSSDLTDECRHEGTDTTKCLGPMSLPNAADLVNLLYEPNDPEVESSCRSLQDINPSGNCTNEDFGEESTPAWENRGGDVFFLADRPCDGSLGETVMKSYSGPADKQVDALRFYDDLLRNTTPIIFVSYFGGAVSEVRTALNKSYASADGQCMSGLNIAEGSRKPGDPMPEESSGEDSDGSFASRNAQPLLYIGATVLGTAGFVTAAVMF